MGIASRLPIVAVFMVLVAACTPAEQARSPVQLPGAAPKRAGLEVPPDAWAHPADQTASTPTQR